MSSIFKTRRVTGHGIANTFHKWTRRSDGTEPEPVYAHYTQRPPWLTKAERRKATKVARIARRRNRV